MYSMLYWFMLTKIYCLNAPTESSVNKVGEIWPLGASALVMQKGAFLREEGFLCKAAAHLKFKVYNSADTMAR